MTTRGFICVAFALLALAACDQDALSAGKTDQSSAANIAVALDTCAQNHGPFARSVCSSPTLTALDRQVQRALVTASGNVSDAGAQLLVRNEARWLEAQRIGCGVASAATVLSPEQARCMEGQFRARAQQASTAVQQLGGYTFQRMELVDAAPVTPSMAQQSGLGVDAPAAIVRDIRFPRIDGPQTPEVQRFNDLVAQQPSVTLDEATNEIVDYRIVYAGPELISVRFDGSQDALGAAHPNSTSKAVTVLMGEGRELTESDVFQADTRWQDFITQRAVADLARQFREDGFTPPQRDVRETATKPHLWLVSERGLTILFPPYSFGAPYVMGGTDVTIPWADLRPYLNPAAPLPIRPAA
ncbi:MAG: DUF3298 domain-containing protein [Proteobacteria bacterium]|nr:DUF3298 domain-containing protein [Pseudomonadota bacterium]